ncbi:MAG TPA: PilX N-terminal domain-containing pilus assembly protein [Burkholderiaceae bacterium]|nr:PilX N-terminal domain-containing pilus assembly protein [Burkholderiaceae bacterium]
MKQPTVLRKARGAALVVTLVMLVVVTLLGVTAARVALNDERSARAGRDRDLAFQAAESALRDAMTDIDSGLRAALFKTTVGFEANCPDVDLPADDAAAASSRRGLCTSQDATATRQAYQDVDFDDRGVPFGTFTQRSWNASVVPSPNYIVETVPCIVPSWEVTDSGKPPEMVCFRITAVGRGPAGSNIEVALQSYYVRIP